MICYCPAVEAGWALTSLMWLFMLYLPPLLRVPSWSACCMIPLHRGRPNSLLMVIIMAPLTPLSIIRFLWIPWNLCDRMVLLGIIRLSTL